jgi:hypothetical protein
MHLLIPYANSHSPECQAALKSLKLPNLDKLLRRLPLAHTDAADDTTLSPPHERAMASACGISAADGQIPFGAFHAAQAGRAVAPGEAWAVITPCHWAVQSQHISLLNPRALNLQEDESRALLAAMLTFFAEDGIELIYDKPTRWLAHGAVFAGLATASPYRVIDNGSSNAGAHKSVDDWHPRGDAAKPLRRLQQEMQMLLYTHALTDARNERGALAVNSFWVSGTGAMTTGMTGAILSHSASSTVTPINTLRDAAMNVDWVAWAQAWQQIDANECAAMLDGLQRKGGVSLTLCGERTAQIYGDLNGFDQIYHKSSKNSLKTGQLGVLYKVMNFLSPQPTNNIISLL